MSFCRFSTDDFRCDFYAYESKNGFHLYVAGNRINWDPPVSPYDPSSLELSQEEFGRVSREYHEALERAPREPIGLEGAGGDHLLGTLRELRDMIGEHMRRGFRAPGWLLPSLDEELALGEGG